MFFQKGQKTGKEKKWLSGVLVRGVLTLVAAFCISLLFGSAILSYAGKVTGHTTSDADEVYAAETVTVGKFSGSSVTQSDSISLGTVDLSSLDPDEDRYIVTYRMGIKFANTMPYLSYGDVYADNMIPAGSTFSCDSPTNFSTYNIAYFDVTFDAVDLSAATYKADVKVKLPKAVTANGGVYKCTAAEGGGYVLTIPVSIKLTGENPRFKEKVSTIRGGIGNNCAVISWSPVENCYSYSVFRREGTDSNASAPDLSKYQYLDGVTTAAISWEGKYDDTLYVDTYAENGTTYSYLVIAGGSQTPYGGNPSKSVAVTPKESARVRPAPPYSVGAGGIEGGPIEATWSWNKHGGKDDPLLDWTEYDEESASGIGYVDHFNIYRNGKLVNQVRRDAVETYESSDGTKYYTWSGTAPVPEQDINYYIWVTAVAEDGTESFPSERVVASTESDNDLFISSHSAQYYEEDEWDEDYEHIIKTYKGLKIELNSMGVDRFDYLRKEAGAVDSTYQKVTFSSTPNGKKIDADVETGKVYTYKITGYAQDGRKTEPYEFNVAVSDDDEDYWSTTGGDVPDLRMWTVDGESVSFHWYVYAAGTYKLFRNGNLIRTWTNPDYEVYCSDTPDGDGTYRYQMKWTSQKFPALTVSSTVQTFVRDTSDPDPETFDKVPGAPVLQARPLKWDDGTSLAVMLNWRPSNDGGEADGYIIYRKDAGHYNTWDWEHSLSWGNPKRNAGEPALDRYWCVKGDVTAYQIDHIIRSDSYSWEEDDYSDYSPHEFWIVPYNEAGLGEPSNVVTLNQNGSDLEDGDDSEAPGAPAHVRAFVEWADSQYVWQGLNGTLKVVWGAPESGGGFDEYRVSLDWGDGDPIVSTYGMTGTHEATLDVGHDSYIGKTCTVTVSAVQKNGAATSAEPVEVTVESMPAFTVEATGSSSVKLTWTALQYDEETEVSEYQIWRRSNAGAWQNIKTCAGDADKEWSDTGLKTETKYEYYIIAVDAGGFKHQSQTKNISLTARSAGVQAPTDFRAYDVDGDVILSWTPPAEGSLPVKYRLEYSTGQGDWSGIDLSDTFGYSTGAAIMSWEWKYGSGYQASSLGAYAGQTLHLRVRSVPQNGNWSDPCEEIVYTWPTEDDISRQQYWPTPIDPEITPGDGQVTIRWDKVADPQSTAPHAVWFELIKTWRNGGNKVGVVLMFPADNDENDYIEYIDTDVINGQEYTYELHPCNSRYGVDSYSNSYWYDPLCYMHQKSVIPNGKTTNQLIAENVAAMAEELIAGRPDSLSDMTEEYHDLVMQLKENYAELTAYQKKLIGSETCKAIEQLISDVMHQDSTDKYEDDPRIVETEDLISALDEFPGDIGLDDPDFEEYEAAVAAARSAYNALPDDAKELIENVQVLIDAENRIKQLKKDAADQALADDLSERLSLLDPESINAETLTDELERQIEDLRCEYDQMTKAQKAKLDPDALEKLFACEENISIAHGMDHIHQMKHVSAIAPTCSAAGRMAYYRCDRCGHCFTDAAGQNEIDPADTVMPADPLAHDWGEWTETTPATCTEGGIEERVCKYDSLHRESRSTQAKGHSWNDGEVTKEATQEEDGEVVYTCSGCGLTKTARIEYGGEDACEHFADHEWGEGEIITPATCSTPGEIKYTCTKCHVAIKYEVDTDPLAHDWGEWETTQEATCTESGVKVRKCLLCDETETGVIDPIPHAWDDGTITKKPTPTATGIKTYTCTACGLPMTEILAKPVITLAATSYTYNGKVRKPAVTVKSGNTKLSTAHYSVSYASGRKNVGTYSVTVKMKGDYAGSKKLSFKINPKGTAISKVTPAKKAFTVKWKKQGAKMAKARITGYQIQYSLNSKFKTGNKTVSAKGYSTVSKKITRLKAGKKYYVRVRTYMKVGKTTLYSPWSKVKTVKTK